MKRTKIILLIIISGILFLLYCNFESRWVKVTELTIKSKDLPESFSGKKIVFISDVHHGPFLSQNRLQKLVTQINNLEPDFIILGGDYVHRSPKYIKPVFDEFQKLNSKLGIYGVLGNHDHMEDPILTKKHMKMNGIEDCDNNSFWINIGKERIKIGGTGDLWNDKQILENTISDVKESDYCILIFHNPDYLEKLKTNLIDLTLSGHTHGGQVTFFGLWAPVLPSFYGQKYRYGLVENNERKSYISSGIGTITPPLRFFARPEIVLITLDKI